MVVYAETELTIEAVVVPEARVLVQFAIDGEGVFRSFS